MIVISMVLVVVGFVTLMLGVLDYGEQPLYFIYASIGSCILAGVFLIAGVLRSRPSRKEVPAPTAGGAAAAGWTGAPGDADTTQALPREEPEPAPSSPAAPAAPPGPTTSPAGEHSSEVESWRPSPPAPPPSPGVGRARMRAGGGPVGESPAAEPDAAEPEPTAQEPAAQEPTPPAGPAEGAATGGPAAGPEPEPITEPGRPEPAPGAPQARAAPEAEEPEPEPEPAAEPEPPQPRAEAEEPQPAAEPEPPQPAAETEEPHPGSEPAPAEADDSPAQKAPPVSGESAAAAKKAPTGPKRMAKKAGAPAAEKTGASAPDDTERPTSPQGAAAAKGETRRIAEALSGLEGCGLAQHRSLAQRFGSYDDLEAADVDEIADVAGVSQDLAQRIHQRLHG